MNRIQIEGMLTNMENDPDMMFANHDDGRLGASLYLELLRDWDIIPEQTRAVMALVGASLKQRHYKQLQAEIDANAALKRASRGK